MTESTFSPETWAQRLDAIRMNAPYVAPEGYDTLIRSFGRTLHDHLDFEGIQYVPVGRLTFKAQLADDYAAADAAAAAARAAGAL
jgi:hypothetical protein